MSRDRSLLRRVLLIAVFALGGMSLLMGCSTRTGGKKLSLEDAANLVLEEVVKPDDLDHQVIVFSYPEPVTPDDRLHSYRTENFERPGNTISIQNESWLFWVEDYPGAAFSHPVRYVLVDQVGGDIHLFNQKWWPVLNDTSLWVETSEYWDEDNWAFSNVEWRPSSVVNPSRLHSPHTAVLGLPFPASQSESDAALVVNGWEEGQTLSEDMQTSALDMVEALSGAGFEVTFLGPPGGNILQNIDQWIEKKAQELKPSQTAMIHIVGHGGTRNQQGLVDIGRQVLSESALVDMLSEFDPGVHVIVVLDFCYSGSFLDGLEDLANISVTSTSPNSVGYGDIDYEDVNPEDSGYEFSSGFISDWNEILADKEEREKVEEEAERLGRNLWEALAVASFESALEKDSGYQHGWTSPMIQSGSPSTRPPTPTPVPPTPTPQPEVSFVEEYEDETLAALDAFAERMGLDEGDKALLVFAYLLDPAGDWVDSIKEQEVGRQEPQVDITGGSGVKLEMRDETASQEFEEWIEENVPCDPAQAQDSWMGVCPGGGSSSDPGIPRYGVLKSMGYGAFPPGDVYMFTMTLDGKVPLQDEDNLYIYSLVVDADGVSGNNFQAQPPFTWDYFQGTDQWYRLMWDPAKGEWDLLVTGPTNNPIESQARVLVVDNLIVFFIPGEELEVEFPGYRLTAFMSDGTFDPANRGGDVLGENPTQPLFTIPEEPIVLEGGGG